MCKRLLIYILLHLTFISNAQVSSGRTISDFYLINIEPKQPKNYKIIRRIKENKAIVVPLEADELFFEGQNLINDLWKISPSLALAMNSEVSINKFLIRVLDANKVQALVKGKDIRILKYNTQSQSISIEASWKVIENEVLSNNNVIFIDLLERSAKEEASIRSHDIGLNGIEYVHNKYPGAAGDAITISVKERTVIPDDIDIIGRHYTTVNSDSITSLHATEMATLIGGAGNSFYNGMGVANMALLTSANFSSLLPEEEDYYSLNNITIQNHSYGVGIENYYGIESQAFDQLTVDNPTLVHVFSAGNSGTSTSDLGKYAGIDGMANITGSFKQSKNNLVIAAVDTVLKTHILSSKGPAFDGRIKPDLSAFGGEGTSEATALVSGSVAVIQQYFSDIKNKLPESSLVKAALVAGANDIGAIGIDYAT